METMETRSNHVSTKIINPQQQISTNLTRRFPVTSNRCNNNLFILYDYNSNFILVLPMKSRAEKEFISIFQDLHVHLTTRGLKHNYMRLKNEASPASQCLLKDKCINYQLEPPIMQRRYSAERAISTFKDHFIAGLCATDLDFPMQNWDRLLKQAEITLKLLCLYILNPILSSYAQLNG